MSTAAVSDASQPTPEQLATIPLLATLTPAQLADLARQIDLERVAPGRVIVREGGDGYAFYLVFEGRVEVRHDEVVIGTLGPGDYFGEIGILTGSRRTATVKAQTLALVGSMFGTTFRVLEDEHPEIAAIVREAAAARQD